MYLERVKPNGLFALHVSNRFMDLENVASVTENSPPGVHVAKFLPNRDQSGA
jgi:hypothetical protein